MAAPQLPVLASDNNLPAVISDVQLDKIHKPMQGVLLGLDILHKAQPTAQGTKDVIDDLSTQIAKKTGRELVKVSRAEKNEGEKAQGLRLETLSDTLSGSAGAAASGAGDTDAATGRSLRNALVDPVKEFAEEELHPTTLLGYAFDDNQLAMSMGDMLGGMGSNLFALGKEKWKNRKGGGGEDNTEQEIGSEIMPMAALPERAGAFIDSMTGQPTIDITPASLSAGDNFMGPTELLLTAVAGDIQDMRSGIDNLNILGKETLDEAERDDISGIEEAREDKRADAALLKAVRGLGGGRGKKGKGASAVDDDEDDDDGGFLSGLMDTVTTVAMLKGGRGGGKKGFLKKIMKGGLGKKLKGLGKLKNIAKIGAMGGGAMAMGGAFSDDAAEKASKEVTEKVAKETTEQAGKQAGKQVAKKAGAKGLGKSLLKKIPGVGLLAGLAFGAQRAMSGDFSGAMMEVASGGLSMIPGIGTAASMAMDAGLMAKDLSADEEGEGEVPSEITKIEPGMSDENEKAKADIKKRFAKVVEKEKENVVEDAAFKKKHGEFDTYDDAGIEDLPTQYSDPETQKLWEEQIQAPSMDIGQERRGVEKEMENVIVAEQMGLPLMELGGKWDVDAPLLDEDKDLALAEYAEQKIGKDKLLDQVGSGGSIWNRKGQITTSGGTTYHADRVADVGRELAAQELTAPAAAAADTGVEKVPEEELAADTGVEKVPEKELTMGDKMIVRDEKILAEGKPRTGNIRKKWKIWKGAQMRDKARKAGKMAGPSDALPPIQGPELPPTQKRGIGGAIKELTADTPDTPDAGIASALGLDTTTGGGPDEKAATKIQEAETQKQDAEKKKEKGSTAIAMDNSVSNVSNPSTTTMSSRRSTGNDADVAMAHSF